MGHPLLWGLGERAKKGETAALNRGWTMSSCTRSERTLIEAVLMEYHYRKGAPALSYDDLIFAILQERQGLVHQHEEFGELSVRFLQLPQRRQFVICERLGLLRDDDLIVRDEDELYPGSHLFFVIFQRVLERGALRHFKIQLDFERDQCGRERTTASPSDLPKATS
jgi:hypothetical protein